MKRYLIQILYIVVLLCFYPVVVYGSFKEIWKGNLQGKIDKLSASDMNKNNIKEILILSGKKLKLIEWDKDTFVNRWQPSEFKAGVDFEYYDFTDSLWIKEFNSAYSQEYERLFKCKSSLLRSYPPKLDKPEEFGKYDAFIKALIKEKCGEMNPEIKPAYFHILLYQDDKYFLRDIEESMKSFWQSEKYLASGSFSKKGAKDVIVTTEIITYGRKPEGHLYLREARSPDKILWTSPFTIFNYGVVPLFGDFDGDQKIELLLLLEGETKGYWIFPKGNEFEVKEIKSYRKTKDTTLWLFPLSTSDPERYFKIGRTTSKNFDEIFYIHEYLYGGPLFKAVWQKDRFNYQEILSIKKLNRKKRAIGYDNLNLIDIDNDALDEIIVSEIRGDIVETEEEPDIANRRDVIHILKWDGKEYKKIWTSQALGAITQVLIDDVTGDGKKEIIVGNDKGEIHIFWGK